MITGRASVSIFLATCLRKAKPTPGFCDQVPARQDKEGSRAWVETKCKELGHSSVTCGAALGGVIAHCQNRENDAAPEPTKEEKKK